MRSMTMIRITRCALIGVWFLLAAATAANASELPSAPRPSGPFPQILTDAFTSEFVAPGVTFANYSLFTKDGPIEIHVIAVDPKAPDVRIDTVLADDSLVSAGETPSSMALRTGAVAGINADYFDIGNTNEPLGIVVRSGELLHAPNAHSAFVITRDRRVLMMPLGFSGSAQVGTTPVLLEGINEYPPRSGVSLIMPQFGVLHAAEGVTIAQLSLLDAGASASRYRIDSVLAADHQLPRGYALAISSPALETIGTPQIGDVVTITQTSDPEIQTFAAAAGGGPLILHQGQPYDEADAPAAAEGRTRIPISGAALRADGTLLLIEVDGREPLHSIGLTRAEFASFLLALGTTEAVSFDGGGSSALVARRLGERNPSLRSQPSDGSERPVADGIFVYSDAPVGPPARLVVHPAAVRAFTGSRVALISAVTDAAGHQLMANAHPIWRSYPASLGAIQEQAFFVAGNNAGDGHLFAQSGPLSADLPVHVVNHVARVVITPRRVNLEPDKSAQFAVQAFDAGGYPVALPEHLEWSAAAGTITDTGRYTAGTQNAVVQLKLGNTIVREPVSVGEHEAQLQMGQQWRFTSTPANNPGQIDFGVPCPVCIQLQYDFTNTEHGATMVGDHSLPEDTIGLRFDVEGDGNGEVLRVSLINAINERVFLTVGRVNWQGWQTKEVRFPSSLIVPARLHTIYVLSAFGGSQRVQVTGKIAIRNVRIILAGKE